MSSSFEMFRSITYKFAIFFLKAFGRLSFSGFLLDLLLYKNHNITKREPNWEPETEASDTATNDGYENSRQTD